MNCRLCNRSMYEIGGYLQRVNETGVAGIWECRPSCDAKLSPDDAILQAITGDTVDEQKEKCE